MTPVDHLYLHVPFCRRHCPYCDAAVTAGSPARVSSWRDIIRGELRLRGDGAVLATPLQTLLVGGGTPSTLGSGLAPAVLDLLGVPRLEGIEEWTVEANPEDVTGALLAGWRERGVTRVNLGIQSHRPDVLRWLGRTHSPAAGEAAVRAVARAHFKSWGIDLLYGLPPRVDPGPDASVEWAMRRGVPHISLYELVAEPGTPLGDRLIQGIETPADDEARADQYLRMTALLEAEGYEAYEMMAFARPSHESRHARAILEGRDFLGLGPGAHSWIGGRAWTNLRDWRGYVGAVKAGIPPGDDAGETDTAGSRGVRLASRLRLREGIPFEELTAEAVALGRQWMQTGLARQDAERLRLTPEGWLLLDSLALTLDHAQSEGSVRSRHRRPPEET